MKTLITKTFKDIHQAKFAPASPGYFHDFTQFIKYPQAQATLIYSWFYSGY